MSLCVPLTAVDRYGNWLEKGKGALLLRRLLPVIPPPGFLLRRIANRVMSRVADLSLALPTPDLRHLFLPSFHTHLWRQAQASVPVEVLHIFGC